MIAADYNPNRLFSNPSNFTLSIQQRSRQDRSLFPN
jgi:hypothetical protein